MHLVLDLLYRLRFVFHYMLVFIAKDKSFVDDYVAFSMRVYQKKKSMGYILQKLPETRNLYYSRYKEHTFCCAILNLIAPEERTFVIRKNMKLGKTPLFFHPFSTVLNAASIGDGFVCRNGCTIGNKGNDNAQRPIIGNNVELGVNVVVIGNITIGDNVIVGAGAVVVKDVPSNCVVVGNPSKVIRNL